MNLKEAFRFQNKLQSLMEEAQSILGCDANITRVQNTYLRKKVLKNFENETTVEAPRTEYSEQITALAEFLLYLLGEREKLTVSICRAKAGLDLPAGLDGEVSLNARDNGDGTYTFVQPYGRVTITVTFVRTGEIPFFVDVPETFWAYPEILWAFENGYVNGTSATTFSPNGAISRQQVWMILARLSGASPANMAEARTWAMEHGISDGTNPGNPVTRQQLVALLFRYASGIGRANDERANLSIFPDADRVADYAVEPMEWSVANDIVSGTSQGTLNPTGTATRAQFAVILHRFWTQLD